MSKVHDTDIDRLPAKATLRLSLFVSQRLHVSTARFPETEMEGLRSL